MFIEDNALKWKFDQFGIITEEILGFVGYEENKKAYIKDITMSILITVVGSYSGDKGLQMRNKMEALKSNVANNAIEKVEDFINDFTGDKELINDFTAECLNAIKMMLGGVSPSQVSQKLVQNIEDFSRKLD